MNALACQIDDTRRAGIIDCSATAAARARPRRCCLTRVDPSVEVDAATPTRETRLHGPPLLPAGSGVARPERRQSTARGAGRGPERANHAGTVGWLGHLPRWVHAVVDDSTQGTMDDRVPVGSPGDRQVARFRCGSVINWLMRARRTPSRSPRTRRVPTRRARRSGLRGQRARRPRRGAAGS